MPDKFFVKISQEDGSVEICEPDDPAYDGPESNINDPEGVYHIEADDADKAEEAAQWLDSMGNDYSGHDIDSDTEFYGDDEDYTDDEDDEDEEDETEE